MHFYWVTVYILLPTFQSLTARQSSIAADGKRSKGTLLSAFLLCT